MTFRSNDVNIGVDPNGAAGDAFGRIRVGQPFSIFESKSIQGSGCDFFTLALAGGGSTTFVEDESMVRLDIGTADGDRVVRQTREYFVYEPGRSQLYIITTKMNTPKTNLTQRVGPFDDDNGIFVENDGVTNNIVLRSSTSGILTERRIPQSSWNLDTADGSGPSEFDLDISKANIYVVDYQWLGVGRVRVGFATERGTYVYAHQFLNANAFDSVYMNNPNLPARWEIKNDGVVGSSSLKAICCGIFSEGGYNPLGIVASTDTGGSTVTVNTPEEVVLAVRLKSQFNRATLIPRSFDAFQTSSDHCVFRCYIADAPTGGSWVDISEMSEANINPGLVSSVLTGKKIQIGTAFVSPSSRSSAAQLESLLRVVSDYAGTSRALVVTAQSYGGNANVAAALQWKEVQ